MTGNYYTDGGIWIDDIRLIDIEGADYLKYPVYYAFLDNLPEGADTFAYQVRSGEQIHPRSEAFTVAVPSPSVGRSG